MALELLRLNDIRLSFGGTPLLTGASLSVGGGDRICLVGRNGSGKSTLLKIAAGLVEPDSGEVFRHPGARISYLAQEPDMGGHATVLDYVLAGLGPTEDSGAGRAILGVFGLTGDEDPTSLSGGEARRAAIARALAADPDVLLIDEPTNHLDLPAIEWLEAELKSRRGAVVMISHDRQFLEQLSRITVWLDRGRTHRLEKGFAAFEAWRDELIEIEEAERHKLDRKIERENQWMHGGVTARRKRNVRRVANLHALRSERREQRHQPGNVRMESVEANASGKLVAEAKALGKAYDGRDIVKDLNLRIMRGDRLGIVGPNGAGKTTLIGLLTDTITPDSGSIRLGTGLEMVTLDQRREALNPEWTVAEALTGGRGDQVVIGGRARHVASYMKDFLFQPEQTRSPLKVLSGGERGRLMLARALAKPSNLLVLDEPTNDLDLETLDVLEDMLGDYAGTVILISHDRDFLDRVVNGVIAPEGEGVWVEYAGGYSDMLAQRGEDLVRKSAPKPAKAEKAAQAAAPAAGAKRKLSFNEQHALKTLPARMDELHKTIARLQKELDDPGLYARDRAKFDRVSATLADAQTELAASEEKWLELEILREEIENR